MSYLRKVLCIKWELEGRVKTKARVKRRISAASNSIICIICGRSATFETIKYGRLNLCRQRIQVRPQQTARYNSNPTPVKIVVWKSYEVNCPCNIFSLFLNVLVNKTMIIVSHVEEELEKWISGPTSCTLILGSKENSLGARLAASTVIPTISCNFQFGYY